MTPVTFWISFIVVSIIKFIAPFFLLVWKTMYLLPVSSILLLTSICKVCPDEILCWKDAFVYSKMTAEMVDKVRLDAQRVRKLVVRVRFIGGESDYVIFGVGAADWWPLLQLPIIHLTIEGTLRSGYALFSLWRNFTVNRVTWMNGPYPNGGGKKRGCKRWGWPPLRISTLRVVGVCTIVEKTHWGEFGTVRVHGYRAPGRAPCV